MAKTTKTKAPKKPRRVPGLLAVAVVGFAIWLMCGHHATATPAHRPAVHSTVRAHHMTAPHVAAKKGKR